MPLTSDTLNVVPAGMTTFKITGTGAGTSAGLVAFLVAETSSAFTEGSDEHPKVPARSRLDNKANFRELFISHSF